MRVRVVCMCVWMGGHSGPKNGWQADKGSSGPENGGQVDDRGEVEVGVGVTIVKRK